MKLYYYTQDHGDGSSSVRWCTEQHYEALLTALDEDESLYANEGSACSLTLPDDFDVSSLGLSSYSFFRGDT